MKRKRGSSTTSSTISTEAIKNIVEKLKLQRCKDSMHRTYWCIWQMHFTGFLIENRLQSATVKSYLSTIRAVLWENNIKLNEDLFLLSSLTRACKLRNDRVLTRLPIQKDLLNLIIKKCQEHFDSQYYLKNLYCALFSTTYYGLFRVGEVTKGSHVLMAHNIHIATNKN